MSRHWMPLYIADYLKDTSHLRALESGAYLHLIMAYWANGKLPTNERQLATIAKLTDEEWAEHRDTLAAFFEDGWTHKRVEAELAEANEKISKKTAAGKAGGQASAKQRASNRSTDATTDAAADVQAKAKQTSTQSQPQPPSKKEIDSAAVHAEFLKVCGTDAEDETLFGSLYGIQGMLSRGFSRETILAGAVNGMRGKARPPNWNYFAKCIESENEQRSAPAKKEIPNGSSGNVIAAADKLLERMRQFDEPVGLRGGEGAAVVRLLPER